MQGWWHALTESTLLVALNEVGDKTQLLALVLAARFKRPWPILAGIAAATLANHALAGAAGGWVRQLIQPESLRYVLAVAFFAMAVWALIPDKAPDAMEAKSHGGIFWTTAVAFFLAEMGDKTQIATVALGARFDALTAVVVGTTLGMLVANAPCVFLGEKIANKIDFKHIRYVAAAAFALAGAYILWKGI